MSCNSNFYQASPNSVTANADFASVPNGTGNVKLQRVYINFDGNTQFGNAPTDLLGFYGATPVARSSAITQTYAIVASALIARTSATLTGSVGTANTALQDVTTTFSQTILNDNFADIAAQINALKVDGDNTAQVLNALIDRLQLIGLIA